MVLDLMDHHVVVYLSLWLIFSWGNIGYVNEYLYLYLSLSLLLSMNPPARPSGHLSHWRRVDTDKIHCQANPTVNKCAHHKTLPNPIFVSPELIKLIFTLPKENFWQRILIDAHP